jgi:hypothetical protein
VVWFWHKLLPRASQPQRYHMNKTDISNCEVKAFKKRDGRVSFHLQSHVFFHTTVSFSIDSYFKGVTGFIQFPGEDWLEFDRVWLASNSAVPFDGKHQVHQFGASFISSKHDTKPCMTRIKFIFSFDIHDVEFSFKAQRIAIVKRGQRGI